MHLETRHVSTTSIPATVNRASWPTATLIAVDLARNFRRSRWCGLLSGPRANYRTLFLGTAVNGDIQLLVELESRKDARALIDTPRMLFKVRSAFLFVKEAPQATSNTV
jgi:hypothetical protein